MKCLFDTNVLIDYLHGVNKAVDLVEQDCERYISVITLTEIAYGAYKTTNPKLYLSQFKQFLVAFSFQIVTIEEDTALLCGQLLASQDIKGKRLSEYDAMIIASCQNIDATLITFDKKLQTSSES